MISKDLLTPFWVAFVASAIAALPVYKSLLALKSRQTVSQHAPEGHQKKQGTPTMGGIIILIGVMATLLWVGQTDIFVIAPLLVLLLGFGAIGFVDDFVVPRLMAGKRGLGWMQKLALQIAFSVGAGLCAGMPPTALAMFTFVILFWSNAYNFADGMDANASLISLGLSVGFFLISLAQPNTVPDIAALAIAGATIPFLYLNAHPAKVFMGDVGALPIGALYGVSFWGLITNPASGHMSVPILGLVAVLISLVMIAELVPVPIQIFSVKVFKRKVFPYTPIHHAFEKAGMPETRVVAMFAIVQLLASLAAATIYWNSVTRVAR